MILFRQNSTRHRDLHDGMYQVVFSSLLIATSSSPATLEDVPLVVDPSPSKASASAIGMLVVWILALGLGTFVCLLAGLGFCRWCWCVALCVERVPSVNRAYRLTHNRPSAKRES